MPEGTSTFKFGFGQLLLWILLVGAFLIAYLPVIIDLVHAWGDSEDNSHGFMVLPIVFYVVWLKRKSLLFSSSDGSWSGLLLAFLSLTAYLFARVGGVATFTSFSLVSFLSGTVIFLFGYRAFRELLFPLFLLLFMIPVPAQLQAALTIPLQLLVSKSAVALSNLTGIPLYREGNVIFHAKGTFEVVQACSGLRSITALLMLGAVLGYLTLNSNVLRTLLFVSAIPIAVTVNIVRVFSMITALHFLDFDLTHGTLHTLLGTILFGAAIGLFLVVQKGLARCDR